MVALCYSHFISRILNSNEKFKPFVAGFIAVFIPWLVYIMLINQRNDGILAARIAALFKHIPSFVLILVCSLLGWHFRCMVGLLRTASAEDCLEIAKWSTLP
jgi:hypothetical protein